MIKNKKGLSDVITTVLIILLVLAAVVLIWGFLSRQLNQSTDTIAGQTKCLDTPVEVTGCTLSGDGTVADPWVATVNYKASGKLANINNVSAIVSLTGGTTNISYSQGAAQVGQVVVGASANKPLRAAVSSIVSDPKGAFLSCTPTNPVDCS